MDNLTIILIMIAVMIVIPVIFARLSGRNPMEFPVRNSNSVFGVFPPFTETLIYPVTVSSLPS